jgi:hypothetical protein
MVLGCRTPHLAVFLLSNYKLLRLVTLPEYIQTIKHVDFIPQLNDGGSNKIVAILSGRGTIYFYDIDQNVIISELVSSYEISKYDYSTTGSYIACVLVLRRCQHLRRCALRGGTDQTETREG